MLTYIYSDMRLLTETLRKNRHMEPSTHHNLAVLCLVPSWLSEFTLTHESHSFGLCESYLLKFLVTVIP